MLIAFSGKKRCGKDVGAEVIAEIVKNNCKYIDFTDPIKAICRIISPSFSYIKDEYELWKNGSSGILNNDGNLLTGRQLMQKIGTDGMRKNVAEDIWIQTYMNALSSIGTGLVLTTDLRFPNELMAVKESGGKVIRVKRGRVDFGDQHETETALDNTQESEFDYIVKNNGTIHEYAQKIMNIFKEICDEGISHNQSGS